MFYFLPADMITQILDFGLPAPIDIQIDGMDLEGNRKVADQHAVAGSPGAGHRGCADSAALRSAAGCISRWTARKRRRRASRSRT